MDNKRRTRGISPFFVVLVIFLVYWVIQFVSVRKQTITYDEFQSALQHQTIASVVIEQSKAVPTGTLRIQLKGDRETRYLEVSDVNETQVLLKEAGIEEIKVLPVPKDSLWLTTLLPTMLVLGVVVFMFIMMNRQGGANAKAMDFGRNRARMSKPSAKKITFLNVAG